MNDIDYQVLLSAYQKKVSELSNQVVIYEAKITSLSSLTSELTDKITKLESSKSRKKIEESSDF
jgi:prefoldin subunit 5